MSLKYEPLHTKTTSYGPRIENLKKWDARAFLDKTGDPIFDLVGSKLFLLTILALCLLNVNIIQMSNLLEGSIRFCIQTHGVLDISMQNTGPFMIMMMTR